MILKRGCFTAKPRQSYGWESRRERGRSDREWVNIKKKSVTRESD